MKAKKTVYNSSEKLHSKEGGMPSAIIGRRDVMSRTNGNNGAPFQTVSFPKGVMWHSSINMKKVTVYLSRIKKL